MSKPKTDEALSPLAEVGDLAIKLRQVLTWVLWPLAAVLGVGAAVLYLTGHPGANAFTLIAAGSWLVFKVWSHFGLSLPILPMLALQNLLSYGLPIVLSNPSIMVYSADDLTSAGLEVLIFSLSLVVAWRIALIMLTTSPGLCYALQGFNQEGMKKLERMGFILIIGATCYQLLQSLQILGIILDKLPSGTSSLITPVVSGISTCGFFLVAMMLGRGDLSRVRQAIFWGALALNCFIAASGFLLSSTATYVFSVLIGLFWSSGRVPWRFLVVTLTLLSFLNLGKFTMREKYWRLDSADMATPDFTLQQMPATYSQWLGASYDAMTGADDFSRGSVDSTGTSVDTKIKGQSMLDRINNLQNILYVQTKVQRDHVTLVGGVTYEIIPELLIPRILWPDKPRTHEGQVILNTHFGRQDLMSTFQTYVAWGLLAEAYGNFGPYLGACLLGVVLGVACAWVEKYVARKLLLSLEGFLSFTLFLGLSNSFEMVASVLITSLFQAFIPIIIASSPFVQRLRPRKSAPKYN